MGTVPIFMVGDRTTDYFPLGLGLMKACLQQLGSKDVRFMGVLNQSEEDTVRVAGAFGPGLWLFSNYVWNRDRNLRISSAIKALDTRNITVHGGPSLPKYPPAFQDLVRCHPHIDIGIRGEGEHTLASLVEVILGTPEWYRLEPGVLQSVAGLSFVGPDGSVQRSPDRARIEELDALPSPYLSGIFDKMEGLAWTVESNRGCPYRCAFCDWGSLTAQKIKKFHLERVKQELEWGARRRLPTLFLSDANFGIFERDIEIARFIASLRRRYGYPTDVNVTFAKNAPERVADIVKTLHRNGVFVDATLALQTTDPATLKAVGRSNIPVSRYEHLTELFLEEGLQPSSDLMVRLPGQTYRSFKSDIQTFLDRDMPVLIHPTLVLPNSPMASPEFMKEWNIQADDQGRVISCRSFTEEEGRRMLALRNAYFFTEFYSFFRYVMRFLQWDHQIPGSDFLEALVEDFPWFSKALRAESQPYDFAGHAAFKDLLIDIHHRSFPFYEQTKGWVLERFKIPTDSALHTVFQFNESVIPALDGIYPQRLDLAHNVAEYFTKRSGKLSTYPPARVVVTEVEAGQAAKLPFRRSARDWVWELKWSS